MTSGSTSVQKQLHGPGIGAHGSAGSAPLEQPPLQPQRDNPFYAARLISLANYIRHIISLSSGNSPLHAQSTLVHQRLLLQRQQQQSQQQRQQQKLQECRPSWATANRPQQDSASPPSPLSAGPGPIKNNSLSTRRHRQTSEYHDHASRRQHHHLQQQQPALAQDQQVFQQSLDPTQDLPSPTSPTFQVGRRSSQPLQPTSGGNEKSAAAGAAPKLAMTIPKVPFPNLTLTLALIYVDRLKEVSDGCAFFIYFSLEFGHVQPFYMQGYMWLTDHHLFFTSIRKTPRQRASQGVRIGYFWWRISLRPNTGAVSNLRHSFRSSIDRMHQT